MKNRKIRCIFTYRVDASFCRSVPRMLTFLSEKFKWSFSQLNEIYKTGIINFLITILKCKTCYMNMSCSELTRLHKQLFSLPPSIVCHHYSF